MGSTLGLVPLEGGHSGWRKEAPVKLDDRDAQLEDTLDVSSAKL